MSKFKITFCLITFLIIGGIYLSQGKDEDIVWNRRVPSRYSTKHLERNWSTIARWPSWFFSVESVHLKNRISDSGEVQTGDQIEFNVISGRVFKKKTQLTFEITHHVPEKALDLRLLADSSGQLTRMFSDLSWKMEFHEHHDASEIHAKVIAHTAHWKARLFGRLSPSILLNQVFYPDLIKLAEMKSPFVIPEGVLIPGGGVGY